MFEEEKKEEAPKENADVEDWNMDDVSWGDDDNSDKLDPKLAEKKVESMSD